MYSHWLAFCSSPGCALVFHSSNNPPLRSRPLVVGSVWPWALCSKKNIASCSCIYFYNSSRTSGISPVHIILSCPLEEDGCPHDQVALHGLSSCAAWWPICRSLAAMQPLMQAAMTGWMWCTFNFMSSSVVELINWSFTSTSIINGAALGYASQASHSISSLILARYSSLLWTLLSFSLVCEKRFSNADTRVSQSL